MELSRKIRQRFVKDYNLPINLFDKEHFDYYAGLYDFFPKEDWICLKDDIQNKFDGNEEAWLQYCAEARDRAIDSILNSEDYKAFNSRDLSEYNISYPCGERSVYTEATNGQCFLSIDLKKANFQALRYVDVIKDETYPEFIIRNGGDSYIYNSKYLRQVIFGKCNPSRQIKVEKYIINQIYSFVKGIIEGMGFAIYSMNSDEVIFEDLQHNGITETEINCIVSDVKSNLDFEISGEYFKIERLPIVNCADAAIDAYIKHDLNSNNIKYKKVSTTFFPQVYKLYHGKNIGEADLDFFVEGQVARFLKPLTLKIN